MYSWENIENISVNRVICSRSTLQRCLGEIVTITLNCHILWVREISGYQGNVFMENIRLRNRQLSGFSPWQMQDPLSGISFPLRREQHRRHLDTTFERVAVAVH